MTWEEIALEYRKEINELHRDIESAIAELEKKMPRSFEKGIGDLNHALYDSLEKMYLIRLSEYSIIDNANVKPKGIEIKKKIEANDWLGDLL